MISTIIYPEVWSTQKLSLNDDGNYLIWKLKISFVLKDHGVDYVLTHSNPSDPKWVQDDNTARNKLILPALDDLLRSLHRNDESAKSIMDSLEKSFKGTARLTRKMILMRDYKGYRMVPGTHINQHLFRMRAMAKQLDYFGTKFPEGFHAVALLNSLPEDWKEEVEGLMFGLDLSKEELSVDNVTRRVRIVNDIRKLRAYSGKKCRHKSKRSREEASSTVDLDLSGTLTQMLYSGFKTNRRLESMGTNFVWWESELPHVLDETKVHHVLTDQKPADEDPNQIKWLSDELLCRHLILGTLDDDLFLSFHDYPTAKSLMDAICTFFKFSSAACRMLRFKKYMDHRMSDDTPVWNHILKMDKLAWKLKRSGLTIPDEMQAVILMNSLPDSWGESMTAVRMNMDFDEVDLVQVRNKIRMVGDFREMEHRNNEVETSSKNSGSKYKKGIKGCCHACGRPGHYKYDCPY